MTAAPAPVSTRPPRLAPLAKLPVFLDLAGRRVVVIGGGEPVVWKAELLLAAGAAVVAIATDPHPELEALAGANASFRLERRSWTPSDLDGSNIVVADLAGSEALGLRRAARDRGLLVNVIDNPDVCDFQFGTIVNRSPVVVGIMTDGAAPILGQAIRRRVEALLPFGLAAWAAAAKTFRQRLKARLPAREDRRRFWELFVDRAFTAAAPDGKGAAELDRLADRIASETNRQSRTDRYGRTGEVVIVGAGPGDPELLTLKAMRELQAADVIVYDRLVTPEVLELARREARRVHVGKEGHGAACRQEDISALLVDLALAGERVVRLKGGDPAVFGRTGEEVEACRAAGVPVRIVPGVTSASAAAASLDLSLTHRDHAGRVQFVTGHDRRGDLPADLDGAALADPRSTLVVYMGRRTAGRLARRLLDGGLAASTPVLAVSDVSRPNQATLRTDLGGLAEGIALPDRSPVIILIGAALDTAASREAASTPAATAASA